MSHLFSLTPCLGEVFVHIEVCYGYSNNFTALVTCTEESLVSIFKTSFPLRLKFWEPNFPQTQTDGFVNAFSRDTR
jgi:hypothetical protein